MSRIKQDWGLFPRKYKIQGKPSTVWWYYIWGPDGVRYRQSTGKSIKAEAHNEVVRRIGLDSAVPGFGALSDKPVNRGPTVAEMGSKVWDWDGDYITNIRLKGSITQAYVIEQAKRFETYIAKIIGTTPIAEVGIGDLEAIFLDLHRAGLANKTLNNIYGAAKTVWDETFRVELIEKNPFHRMNQFEARSEARAVLTVEQATALLNRKWWRDDVVWAINVLGAAAGGRVAELASLKIKKLRPDRVRVETTIRDIDGLVEDTKTGDLGKRWSAIPPQVYQVLQVVTAGRGDDEFVFRNSDGRKNQWVKDHVYTNDHIGLEVPVKQLKAAVTRYNSAHPAARLPAVDFHSWRHFVVSELSARCGPDAVSLQVGHVVAGVKKAYLHQTEAHVQDCLKAMTEIFKDWKPL